MLTAKQNEQLETVAAAMGKHERISLDAAERLIAILEEAPDAALIATVQRRVKFAHAIARRILNDRGVKLP